MTHTSENLRTPPPRNVSSECMGTSPGVQPARLGGKRGEDVAHEGEFVLL